MANNEKASTVAITVLLRNESAAYLDEVSAAIRRRTGQAISRSALIRAMTEGLEPLYGEWLLCRTEAEVKGAILQRLPVPSVTLVSRKAV